MMKTNFSANPARLDGAPNFRDMAGYESADGRKVRPGKLFRSELLLDVTEKDLSRIEEMRIEVICDLRSPEERRLKQNRWNKEQPVDIIAVDYGYALEAAQATHWRERLADPSFNAEQARNWMMKTYSQMPGALARHLAMLFEKLDSPQTPAVLVHCAAGKDRTGFVCAMLLWALGVSWDAIVVDFLESNQCGRSTDEMVDMVARRHFNGEKPFSVEALLVITGVSEDFLTTAIKVVEQDFGSIDAYLKTACGVHDERRSRLREYLLLT